MSDNAKRRLTKQAWRIITCLEETDCGTEDYSTLLRNLGHLLDISGFAAETLDAELTVANKPDPAEDCERPNIRPGPVLVEEDAKEDKPAETGERFKFVSVRGALSDARAKSGVDIVAILNDMGCKGLSDVPPERYGELLERAGIDPDTVEKEG